jgi:putative transposase
MTATLDGVTIKKQPAEVSAEAEAARELVRLARERGLALTGPDGLLKQLTKTVIETALNSVRNRPWSRWPGCTSPR